VRIEPRARERERERESAGTAVEAGRPAGRRPSPDIRRRWLLLLADVIATLRRQPPPHRAAAGAIATPRKPFSAGNAGTRSAASHRVGPDRHGTARHS